ncbi:ABC transporter substrate-binding protein [Paenibacillus methanolicus]|uniref:Multiple sugar transport system substrate-binding protein n=1 Tax=Paenibacillus methanolicus TaxID=582686 RepID=A0A5S5C073_9BACL|nr:extracellular solute-binding protein [Paenibacillus methanolicus]TYP71856.1 multiple sugar transport system substrate-binding protein [Paenibacillus methanolicus]
MTERTQDWQKRLRGEPPIENGFTSQLERKVRERIRMKTRGRRAPLRMVAAAMSIAVLAGGGWWFKDDIQGLMAKEARSDVPAALRNDPLADTAVELKVQQDSMSSFLFDHYGKKMFIIRHPSVSFRSLTPPAMDASGDMAKWTQAFETWMDEARPDVLQLPYNVYVELAAKGKLLSLESRIKSADVGLDAYYEPVTELLRLGGGGELYGLSASFDTSVVYINRKLFESRNVAFSAESGMTVDEILATAARFAGTGTAGLYGQSGDQTYKIVNFMGETSGLQSVAYQDGAWRATVGTEGWQDIWRKMAEGTKTGWLRHAKPLGNNYTYDDRMKQDAFAQGEAAMAIGGAAYAHLLEEYKSLGQIQDDWIAVPIKPADGAPNQDSFLAPGTVYAVNAASANQEAAWEVVKFMAGREFGKKLLTTGVQSDLLSSRLDVLGADEQKRWEAFYAGAADPAQAYKQLTAAKPSYWRATGVLAEAGAKYMKAVTDGELTAAEALERMQAELDKALPFVGLEVTDQ